MLEHSFQAWKENRERSETGSSTNTPELPEIIRMEFFSSAQTPGSERSLCRRARSIPADKKNHQRREEELQHPADAAPIRTQTQDFSLFQQDRTHPGETHSVVLRPYVTTPTPTADGSITEGWPVGGALHH